MIERKKIELCLKDTQHVKQQLLRWGQQFDVFVLLDSSNYKEKYSKYDFVCATLPVSEIKLVNDKDAFVNLKEYQNKVDDWIFGYLTYDLKNDVENLTSSNHDGINFPALHFFQPEVVFFLKGNKLEVSYLASTEKERIDVVLEEILNTEINVNIDETRLHIQNRIPKSTYLNNVNSLIKHIRRGDIYEANFCQEFYSENAVIDPVGKYFMLNEISTPPFASFYKLDNHFLISASPERFIKKTDNVIISQPIKGTAKRGSTPEEDFEIISD